jgi:hypothetical protein
MKDQEITKFLRERMTETEFASIAQGRFTPSDLDEYKRRKHEKPGASAPHAVQWAASLASGILDNASFAMAPLGGVNDETSY